MCDVSINTRRNELQNLLVTIPLPTLSKGLFTIKVAGTRRLVNRREGRGKKKGGGEKWKLNGGRKVRGGWPGCWQDFRSKSSGLTMILQVRKTSDAVSTSPSSVFRHSPFHFRHFYFETVRRHNEDRNWNLLIGFLLSSPPSRRSGSFFFLSFILPREFRVGRVAFLVSYGYLCYVRIFMYSLLENDVVSSIPGAVSLARELFTDFFLPLFCSVFLALYFSRIKLFLSTRSWKNELFRCFSVQGIDEVSRV